MDDKNNKNLNSQENLNIRKLNLKTLSIFQNDAQTIFIFKKTERLVSAIYLITSFLSDSEPIKWKLRDTATRLLSHSINLSSQGHHNRVDKMNNFTIESFEIISFLEICNFSGILSPMNCNIIRFEIEKIIELVELRERGLRAKFLLSKSFFETEESYPSNNTKLDHTIESLNEKDNTKTKDQIFNENLVSEINSHKGHILTKDINKTPISKGHIVKDKNQRYEVIINLLKKTKEINVKDVSGIISDCSEKTIQRELLSLVEKGVLKKEGERRWSKYSLAS